MTVAELTAPSPAEGRNWLTARRARTIGWTLFAVGMAFRAVDLWLASRLGANSVQFSLGAGFQAFAAAIALGTACALVGAIIVSRRPENATGWLYVLVGIAQGTLTGGLAYAGLNLQNGPSQPAITFVWLNDIADFALPFSILALLLALYPDGHLVGPRWRIVVALAVVGGVIRTLEVAFGSGDLGLLGGYANPYRLTAAFGQILSAGDRSGLGSMLLALGAAGAAVSLVVRYRRAPLDGRRQIQWLLLAGAAVLVCSLPLAYSQITGGTRAPAIDLFAVSFVSLSLVPVATLIAITRYRLYEIDRIVNRTLVYGSLTAVLAGVFTAGIAFAQRLFVALTGERSDAAIVLTTLLVATLYAPARKRLEAVVDRRFKYDRTRFGAYRDDLIRQLSIVDPYRAAQRLIGEAVRELGAVGGAVVQDDGSVVAVAGTWPAPAAIRLPIPGHPGRLAALLLGPRSDGQLHDPRAVVDLEELAGLVAAAADRPPFTGPLGPVSPPESPPDSAPDSSRRDASLRG